MSVVSHPSNDGRYAIVAGLLIQARLLTWSKAAIAARLAGRALDQLDDILLDARGMQPRPGRTRRHPPFALWQLTQVDRLIDELIAERLTAGVLASHLGLSAAYFCRLFKQTFGESASSHVLHRRLEKAQLLMINSNESLGQIAASVGFRHHSQMCKAFRAIHDQTPAEWRRRYCADETPA